jgi:alanyl-tRNA synthetase
MGHVDTEACGGTHTMHSSTGEIGCFKIIKRESVQDGVERISYKCGSVAIAYMQEKEKLLSDACDVISVAETELVKGVSRFFSEWKDQRKKIEELSDLLVREEAKEIVSTFSGSPVLRILDVDDSSIRKLGIKISESDEACGCFMTKSGTIVCASGKNSKVSAKGLLEKAISALGGTGGGNDHLAQGRLKKVEHIDL